MAELNAKQIESIKNYGNTITTLKDFITAVQKKPGMYIGYLGNKGFLNMIKEIFDNGIDEVMRADSPCNTLRILHDERTHYVEIEDNGRGIPFNNIIRIFTSQHTSSNYDKKKFDYTSGTHGVGGKVTNALSSKFTVESYVLGEARRVVFVGGYPTSDKEEVIPNDKNMQGTIVSFTPNTDVLGNITVSSNDVYDLVRTLLPLTTVGTQILFQSISLDGKHYDTIMKNEDGIMTYLIDNCQDPFIKPIEFAHDNGTTKAQVVMTYSASSTSGIYSFANFCVVDTVESTHVKGFFAGYKKFMLNYMNKIFLATASGRKKSLTIIEADIRTGLHVVLNVAHIDPIFTGQAKDVLSNEDMFEFVRDLTYKSIEEWSKNNPQELQKLCKYIKDQAVIRTSADEKKVNLAKNYNAAISGLPSKFVKPTSKDWEEIFIVEGDSAGGSIKNFRNNATQGIFPIRGKILNCFEQSTIAQCLENAEVAGITAIIGGGYGKNFDISKVKWKKVISCADADSAGCHINALLLRMVLRLYPQLILAGRFYRAVPPLYMIRVGKKKMYFPDKISLVQYVQNKFSKANTISTLSGKKLPAKEVEKLLYNNYYYIYELEKISSYCKVPMEILQIFLNNIKKSPKQICKAIHEQYRFMNQEVFNGQIICTGIANGVGTTLFMNDNLLSHCTPILNIMENNDCNEYLLNGEKATILDIMRAYKLSEPSNISRLKGLGEQDPEELAESVVYPGDMGNRTLIQYTMDSAMKEIEDIRYYENNKNKLLENLIVTRMDITD